LALIENLAELTALADMAAQAKCTAQADITALADTTVIIHMTVMADLIDMADPTFPAELTDPGGLVEVTNLAKETSPTACKMMAMVPGKTKSIVMRSTCKTHSSSIPWLTEQALVAKPVSTKSYHRLLVVKWSVPPHHTITMPGQKIGLKINMMDGWSSRAWVQGSSTMYHIAVANKCMGGQTEA